MVATPAAPALGINLCITGAQFRPPSSQILRQPGLNRPAGGPSGPKLPASVEGTSVPLLLAAQRIATASAAPHTRHPRPGVLPAPSLAANAGWFSGFLPVTSGVPYGCAVAPIGRLTPQQRQELACRSVGPQPPVSISPHRPCVDERKHGFNSEGQRSTKSGCSKLRMCSVRLRFGERTY